MAEELALGCTRKDGWGNPDTGPWDCFDPDCPMHGDKEEEE
jgi:hypothetical protein